MIRKLLLPILVCCQVQNLSAEEISGLIIPRDNEGMYVRNDEGQFEVNWTNDTKVALIANTRLLSGLSKRKFAYKIHSSKQVVNFSIPEGPITGIKTSRGGKQLSTAIQEAKEEKWIGEQGLSLYFNQKPKKEQLASEEDPLFIGQWDHKSKPRTLSIQGQKYEISLKKGGQTKALLYNLLTVKDCKPFVNRATVIGKREGDILIADQIHIQPIGDQAALDDPNLPRYLFIGDSAKEQRRFWTGWVPTINPAGTGMSSVSTTDTGTPEMTKLPIRPILRRSLLNSRKPEPNSSG